MTPILLLDAALDTPSAPYFRPWLMGRPLRIVRLADGEVPPPHDEVAAVVITGSRASVNDPPAWMPAAVAWLRAALDADLPILGVCFGHQLLGYTLGGPDAVGTAPAPEVGFPTVSAGDDPLLSALGARFPAFLTHEDEVRPHPSLQTLATTPGCTVAALRAPGRRAWGVQFHLEYPRDEVERLLRFRAARHPELRIDPDALLATAPDLSPAATALFGRFLALAG